ncbi:MAG TPA: hypothetical protein ENJ64_00265 [Thiotrichales bacterium]|nr:hypothetical protein [Thiotrichales bacterium]
MPGQETTQHCSELFNDRHAFEQWHTRWRQRLEKETLSPQQRSAQMKKANPKYILRNYMAEIAIRKAEDENDYSEIDKLMQLLGRPFDEQAEFEHYAGQPPHWAQQIAVSCSS